MGSQRKTKEQLRDWLNLVEEETLEPDMPIIDPHHHLWKRNRPYVIDDLWEDTKSGHNIAPANSLADPLCSHSFFIQILSSKETGTPPVVIILQQMSVSFSRYLVEIIVEQY